MSQATLTVFVASAVRLTAPVLIAALGELVAERSGVLNVGIEGMMLFGAFGSVLGANETGNATIGVLVGASLGIVCGLAFGFLVSVLRADQIVAGIGLNILALGLTSFLRQQFLTTTLPISEGVLAPRRIPGLADIPIVGSGLFDQSPILYGTAGLVVLLWLFLKFTSPGLVLRATGEGAAAADSAGAPVLRIRVLAVGFGGLMAGLAGAYLALVAAGGVFVDNLTGGRGYLAIAVTIFGRWQPFWVAGAALLFGAADALQYQGQTLGLSLPPPILLMFPFLLALVTWVVLGKSRAAPADLARPFIRQGG